MALAKVPAERLAAACAGLPPNRATRRAQTLGLVGAAPPEQPKKPAPKKRRGKPSASKLSDVPQKTLKEEVRADEFVEAEA